MSRTKEHRARVRLSGAQHLLGRFRTAEESKAAHRGALKVKRLLRVELERLREVERLYLRSIELRALTTPPQRKGQG